MLALSFFFRAFVHSAEKFKQTSYLSAADEIRAKTRARQRKLAQLPIYRS